MAYRFQLRDAKQSTLKNIAGACPDSQTFIDLVNEAQRRLLKRGNWSGTEWVFRFEIQGCHVTWPRFVQTVLGARFCHDKPAQIFNNHYSFVGAHHHHHGWHSNAMLEDANPAPCYNDITSNTGKLVRYYVTKQVDLGKKITLYGAQYGGQPLQEQTNGIWQNGLTLTAAAPFVSTIVSVTRIESITREATAGPAYLFEYDPLTNLVRDLAKFEPDETNPQYRRSKICNMHRGFRDENGRCLYHLDALIKLAFVPVNDDRDFLIVDDFDALKYAIQGIRADEAGDRATAESCILSGIRELNFTDRNNEPYDQTPVRVNVTDGGHIRNPY